MSSRVLSRVTGYVWCDRHGEIHDDTLDPYDYGIAPEDQPSLCQPGEHVVVYARWQDRPMERRAPRGKRKR